jgi:hypothetical protein
MFSLLAILVIVLAVGVVPTIATLLFSKTSRDDRESRRELLTIAVEVEKATTSWRARHQTPARSSPSRWSRTPSGKARRRRRFCSSSSSHIRRAKRRARPPRPRWPSVRIPSAPPGSRWKRPWFPRFRISATVRGRLRFSRSRSRGAADLDRFNASKPARHGVEEEAHSLRQSRV